MARESVSYTSEGQQDQARLRIDDNEQGSRLDRVLVRHLGNEKKSLVLRLIRKGNVRVNGKRKKPDYRVGLGDEVFLPASLRQDSADQDDQNNNEIPASLLAKSAEVPVLFEDDHILVVDKPAGLVVHGGSGHQAGLIEALKQLKGLDELRLAHRLDRDTSGVLLLAKNLAALRVLTESFRHRTMQKTYFACVSGHLYPYAGRMISRLAKGVVQGGERMVVDHESGKASETDYQVMLESQLGELHFSMVALNPHSGRTHQLRVQLQQEGHSILGDVKYAEREIVKQYRQSGGRGLMLHAWRLRLEHPVTGKELEFRAHLPVNWMSVLR